MTTSTTTTPESTISVQIPPHSNLQKYDRRNSARKQPSEISCIFLDACDVREKVFVQEQGAVLLSHHLDSDEARSAHFVIYASHSSDASESSESIPIGTVRLLPYPGSLHPSPESHFNAPLKDAEVEDASTFFFKDPPEYQVDRETTLHDGVEPYLKLGRLAVLPEYRGKGYADLLIQEAVRWAREHPSFSKDMLNENEKEKVPEWKGLIGLHARESAVKTWARNGFEVDEGMGKWFEVGIRHVGMFRRVELQSSIAEEPSTTNEQEAEEVKPDSEVLDSPSEQPSTVSDADNHEIDTGIESLSTTTQSKDSTAEENIPQPSEEDANSESTPDSGSEPISTLSIVEKKGKKDKENKKRKKGATDEDNASCPGMRDIVPAVPDPPSTHDVAIFNEDSYEDTRSTRKLSAESNSKKKGRIVDNEHGMAADSSEAWETSKQKKRKTKRGRITPIDIEVLDVSTGDGTSLIHAPVPPQVPDAPPAVPEPPTNDSEEPRSPKNKKKKDRSKRSPGEIKIDRAVAIDDTDLKPATPAPRGTPSSAFEDAGSSKTRKKRDKKNRKEKSSGSTTEQSTPGTVTPINAIKEFTSENETMEEDIPEDLNRKFEPDVETSNVSCEQTTPEKQTNNASGIETSPDDVPVEPEQSMPLAVGISEDEKVEPNGQSSPTVEGEMESSLSEQPNDVIEEQGSDSKDPATGNSEEQIPDEKDLSPMKNDTNPDVSVEVEEGGIKPEETQETSTVDEGTMSERTGDTDIAVEDIQDVANEQKPEQFEDTDVAVEEIQDLSHEQTSQTTPAEPSNEDTNGKVPEESPEPISKEPQIVLPVQESDTLDEKSSPPNVDDNLPTTKDTEMDISDDTINQESEEPSDTTEETQNEATAHDNVDLDDSTAVAGVEEHITMEQEEESTIAENTPQNEENQDANSAEVTPDTPDTTADINDQTVKDDRMETAQNDVVPSPPEETASSEEERQNIEEESPVEQPEAENMDEAESLPNVEASSNRVETIADTNTAIGSLPTEDDPISNPTPSCIDEDNTKPDPEESSVVAIVEAGSEPTIQEPESATPEENEIDSPHEAEKVANDEEAHSTALLEEAIPNNHENLDEAKSAIAPEEANTNEQDNIDEDTLAIAPEKAITDENDEHDNLVEATSVTAPEEAIIDKPDEHNSLGEAALPIASDEVVAGEHDNHDEAISATAPEVASPEESENVGDIESINKQEEPASAILDESCSEESNNDEIDNSTPNSKGSDDSQEQANPEETVDVGDSNSIHEQEEPATVIPLDESVSEESKNDDVTKSTHDSKGPDNTNESHEIEEAPINVQEPADVQEPVDSQEPANVEEVASTTLLDDVESKKPEHTEGIEPACEVDDQLQNPGELDDSETVEPVTSIQDMVEESEKAHDAEDAKSTDISEENKESYIEPVVDGELEKGEIEDNSAEVEHVLPKEPATPTPEESVVPEETAIDKLSTIEDTKDEEQPAEVKEPGGPKGTENDEEVIEPEQVSDKGTASEDATCGLPAVDVGDSGSKPIETSPVKRRIKSLIAKFESGTVEPAPISPIAESSMEKAHDETPEMEVAQDSSAATDSEPAMQYPEIVEQPISHISEDVPVSTESEESPASEPLTSEDAPVSTESEVVSAEGPLTTEDVPVLTEREVVPENDVLATEELVDPISEEVKDENADKSPPTDDSILANSSPHPDVEAPAEVKQNDEKTQAGEAEPSLENDQTDTNPDTEGNSIEAPVVEAIHDAPAESEPIPIENIPIPVPTTDNDGATETEAGKFPGGFEFLSKLGITNPLRRSSPIPASKEVELADLSKAPSEPVVNSEPAEENNPEPAVVPTSIDSTEHPMSEHETAGEVVESENLAEAVEVQADATDASQDIDNPGQEDEAEIENVEAEAEAEAIVETEPVTTPIDDAEPAQEVGALETVEETTTSEEDSGKSQDATVKETIENHTEATPQDIQETNIVEERPATPTTVEMPTITSDLGEPTIDESSAVSERDVNEMQEFPFPTTEAAATEDMGYKEPENITESEDLVSDPNIERSTMDGDSVIEAGDPTTDISSEPLEEDIPANESIEAVVASEVIPDTHKSSEEIAEEKPLEPIKDQQIVADITGPNSGNEGLASEGEVTADVVDETPINLEESVSLEEPVTQEKEVDVIENDPELDDVVAETSLAENLVEPMIDEPSSQDIMADPHITHTDEDDDNAHIDTSSTLDAPDTLPAALPEAPAEPEVPDQLEKEIVPEPLTNEPATIPVQEVSEVMSDSGPVVEDSSQNYELAAVALAGVVGGVVAKDLNAKESTAKEEPVKEETHQPMPDEKLVEEPKQMEERQEKPAVENDNRSDERRHRRSRHHSFSHHESKRYEDYHSSRRPEETRHRRHSHSHRSYTSTEGPSRQDSHRRKSSYHRDSEKSEKDDREEPREISPPKSSSNRRDSAVSAVSDEREKRRRHRKERTPEEQEAHERRKEERRAIQQAEEEAQRRKERRAMADAEAQEAAYEAHQRRKEERRLAKRRAMEEVEEAHREKEVLEEKEREALREKEVLREKEREALREKEVLREKERESLREKELREREEKPSEGIKIPGLSRLLGSRKGKNRPQPVIPDEIEQIKPPQPSNVRARLSEVTSPFVANDEPHIKERVITTDRPRRYSFDKETPKSPIDTEDPQFDLKPERAKGHHLGRSNSERKSSSHTYSHNSHSSSHKDSHRSSRKEPVRRESTREKYRNEEEKEARRARRDTEKQRRRAEEEMAEESRRQREIEDDERRQRREERRRKRDAEGKSDKASEPAPEVEIPDEEPPSSPRALKPDRRSSRPHHSSRDTRPENKRTRSSRNPVPEAPVQKPKGTLKSLFALGKKVFASQA